jgi:hypothetical protein
MIGELLQLLAGTSGKPAALAGLITVVLCAVIFGIILLIYA